MDMNIEIEDSRLEIDRDEPIAIYKESSYDVDDFYKWVIEDDFNDDFYEDHGLIKGELTKEEFIEKFEYSSTLSDWIEERVMDEDSTMWDYVSEEADSVLGKHSLVKVEGFNQRWNGKGVVDQIISENDLKSIMEKYINPDTIEVEVYKDRVELSNSHHDGTNQYTLTPFAWDELTKDELLKYIDKDDYEYNGEKLYKANKDDLINYLNDNFEN